MSKKYNKFKKTRSLSLTKLILLDLFPYAMICCFWNSCGALFVDLNSPIIDNAHTYIFASTPSILGYRLRCLMGVSTVILKIIIYLFLCFYTYTHNVYVAIYHIYISRRFEAVSVQSWNLLYLVVTMYLSMAKVERMVGCETYAEYLVLRYPYSDWWGADCTSCCWFWKGFWKLSQYDFQLTFNVICWNGL